MTNALKQYFPQVLEWFRDKDTAIFADFLQPWPNLEAAQRARRDTLVSFFHGHSVLYAATIERRIDAIRSKQPLHTDAVVIEPMRLFVEALLSQLRALTAAIERFDDEIGRVARALPHLPAPDLHRMGGPDYATLLLGPSLLPLVP